MQRAALMARATVGISAALAVLYLAAGSPVRDVNALADPPDFDGALVGAVGLIAWAFSLWLAMVIATVALATGPGAAGGWAATVARRLGPRCIRAAAGWLVGATLIAGPLGSTPGFAATTSSGAAPNLDRPAATAPLAAAPSAAAPSVATPSIAAPSVATPSIAAPSVAAPPRASHDAPRAHPPNVSLNLDRPAAAYLPPPPVEPPRPTASTGSVNLLAGNAHREAPDDGYVVRRGDTLWDIAARHLGPSASAADVAREWPRWYVANRNAIGTDPQLILPGMVLHAPAG